MLFSKRIAYCGSLSALLFSLGAGAMSQDQLEDDLPLMSEQKPVCKVEHLDLYNRTTTQDLGGSRRVVIAYKLEELITTTTVDSTQTTEDWASKHVEEVDVLALKAECPGLLEWIPKECADANQDQCQDLVKISDFETAKSTASQPLGTEKIVQQENRKVTIVKNTETGQFLRVSEWNEELPERKIAACDAITVDNPCQKRIGKVSKRRHKSKN